MGVRTRPASTPQSIPSTKIRATSKPVVTRLRRCGWGSGEGHLAASEEVEECVAYAEGRSDGKGAQDRCDCQ